MPRLGAPGRSCTAAAISVAVPGVGDPGLAAVDDVLVALAEARVRMCLQVRAAGGLGQHHGARTWPVAMRGSQVSLCSGVPDIGEQAGDDAVAAHRPGQAHPAPGQLLGDQCEAPGRRPPTRSTARGRRARRRPSPSSGRSARRGTPAPAPAGRPAAAPHGRPSGRPRRRSPAPPPPGRWAHRLSCRPGARRAARAAATVPPSRGPRLERARRRRTRRRPRARP